jgi:hypothetical protein
VPSYMDRMTTNIDLYYSLNDKERGIVKAAAKAGDNPLTRHLLQLYFPKLSPQDTTNLLTELRAFTS